MHQKRYWFFLSLVVTCVFMGVIIWFVYGKQEQSLFNDALDAQTQLTVLQLLDNQKIDYHINEDKIFVDAEKAGNIRNLLANQGVTQPRQIGYELFDQSEYGLSDFSQKIKLQRALEGELSRTIGQLTNVRYARVHLTPEQTSIYQSQQIPAKAVVIIHMIDQKQLTNSEILGVQQLVSAAVQNLGLEQVLVLNESGHILTGSDLSTGQTDIQEQLEYRLKEKAVALLQPNLILNPNQIAVSVELNFDKVQTTIKKPIIADFGLIPIRRKDSSNQSKATQNPDSSQIQSSKEAEYVFGEEQTDVKYAPYSIERVSVALMMQKSLTNIDKMALEKVLYAGLGLSKSRGDVVDVTYLPTINQLSTPLAPHTSTKVEPLAPKSVSSDDDKFRYFVGFTILLVIIGLGYGVIRRMRASSVRSQPEPISAIERERLLQELQTWLRKD